MITYIDAKNALKYQILFEKAVEALKEHPSEAIPEEERNNLSIASLDDYYAYLPYLMTFPLKEDEGENEDIHYFFAKVPLDEEYFKIDANSRTIKVPVDFAKNGVGVQGDEIAEVVYFAIDRYFDSIDLASVDSIVIQWQTKNGSGISQHFGKSIETINGKEFVVFGWPISSTLTAAAGIIKFAVRFYSVDTNNNVIKYSLTTLPAEVTINATLNYNLFDETIKEDSQADLITKRIKNAGIYNAELPVPKTPTITTPLHVLGADSNMRIVDLPTTGDHSLKLAIGAQPTDIGTIGYEWQKFAYSNGNYLPDSSEYTGEVVVDYQPATEITEGKLYYTVNRSGEGVIKTTVIEDLTNLHYDETEGYYTTTGGSIVYEKLSVATVNQVGIYTVDVTARNRVNTTTLTMAAADGIKIPGPETPVVKFVDDELVSENINTAHIISDNGDNAILKVVAHAGEFDDNGNVKENMGNPDVKLNYVWKQVTGNGVTVPVEGAVPGEIVLNALPVDKVPHDNNYDRACANQGKVTFMQNGNEVIIYANEDELESYTSTDAEQAELGDKKWIGIDIDTGLDTIVDVPWGFGTYKLTASEAAEAIGLGLGAGHIIFWTYFEALGTEGLNIKVNNIVIHITAGGNAPASVEYAFNVDKSEMTIIGLENEGLDRNYIAEVTATRNGISTTETSGTYRITNLPKKPTIYVKDANGRNWVENSYDSENNVLNYAKVFRGEPNKLAFRISEEKSDKLSYIWMRMRLDENDINEGGIQQLAIDIDEYLSEIFPDKVGEMDISLTGSGAFTLTEIPASLGEVASEEANVPVYQLPVDSVENPVAGYYYCIVVNELNGHLAANATPFFNVQ